MSSGQPAKWSMAKMSPAGRVVLAVDTSDKQTARRLTKLAKDCGATYIKYGLQLATATSWQFCGDLAKKYGLQWMADAKLHDIPNTVSAAVGNLVSLDNAPFAITIHISTGQQALKAAKQAAGKVKLFGVTVLTSIDDAETKQIYGGQTRAQKVPQFASAAADAGLYGLVCSAREVGLVKSDPKTAKLFVMANGSRSHGTDHHDQSNVLTPAEALQLGADLIEVGRQVTLASKPVGAYQKLIEELNLDHSPHKLAK